MKNLKPNLWGLLLIMLILFSYLGCSKKNESTPNELLILKNFQGGLSKFYSLVECKIKCDLPYADLKNLLKESYIEIYGSSADIPAFEKSFKNVQFFETKNDDYIENRINYVLNNSETEFDAMKSFEMMVFNDEETLEGKLCFISMKETLEFMTSNNQVLESEYIQMVASKSSEVPCKGWWKCWGKCVASIIGGYYAGGIAGCGVLGGIGGTVGSAIAPGYGTVIGAFSGCATGTLFGGLGGALTGAVLGCDQD